MKKLFALMTVLLFGFLDNPICSQTTIALQPGPEEGKDAALWCFDEGVNHGDRESLTAYAWTHSGLNSFKKSFLAFDLSMIPEGASIDSAFLSLYFNPTDPYESFDFHTGENQILLQRVTSYWDEYEIVWDIQPSTTTENMILLPPSVEPDQDYLDIDVTNLVIDMLDSSNVNHGFMIRMFDEVLFYKSVLFASSDHADTNLRPKLVITYQGGEEEPSPDSLLLYYPFDGTADDASGNGHHGIVHGATLTEDRFGISDNAYYFNGTDNYIEFPNTDGLKPELPVSFSMWVKYDTYDAENGVLFNTSFENNRSSGVFFTINNGPKTYGVGYGDGTYNFGSDHRRSYASNSVIDTSEWHFVVVVVEGPTEMKIYSDCIEEGGSYSGSGDSLVYSDSAGCIGRHDQNPQLPAYYFKGKLDEFKYWKGALTQADVDSLCLITSTPFVETNNSLFKIYPNPTNGMVTIVSEQKPEILVSILDQSGRVLFQQRNAWKLDLSLYPKGLYILDIVNLSDGSRSRDKLIRY